MEMILPNFLVIGAGKSGTTSLYEYLNEHPEVFMSEIKETNFFALEDEQLISPDNDPEQMKHYPWSVTRYKTYQNLFQKVKNEKAIGEVSPMYLYSQKAAKSIKKRLPNVKLIALLREPVDRLYSRYLHLARENRTPSNHFADSLDPSSIWWKRNDLVQEGFYYSHLDTYYKLFSKEQIKVVLYDDFRLNPKQVLKEIYQFIGVEDSFSPDLKTSYNVSGLIVNPKLDQLIGQNSILKAWINDHLPSLAKLLTKQKKVKKWVNKMRKSNLRKPTLSNALRKEISTKIYHSEIEKLQLLIDRDLTHWQYN